MAEQWYYRIFGEEFGPVTTSKLREMVQNGMIGSGDEIRAERSDRWVSAGSVSGLGAIDDGGTVAVAVESESQGRKDSTLKRDGFDDWYWMSNGHELGPLSFEELVKFAELEQLSADDEVKLGINGKWRRVGTIGRLMAVLPYQGIDRQTPAVASRMKTPSQERSVLKKSVINERDVDKNNRMSARSGANPPGQVAPPSAAIPEPSPSINLDVAYQAVYEQAKAQIAASMIAQAETTYRQAEEVAKREIAWASAPNVDPLWWGWMGGVEFGPVPFQQVFALAKNGQLKPSDFIRNGATGQYFPSANTPGLYSAIAAISKAAETLKVAKEQAQTAAALAIPASQPIPLPVQTKQGSSPEVAVRKSDPQVTVPASPKITASVSTSSVSQATGAAPAKTLSPRSESPSNLSKERPAPDPDSDPELKSASNSNPTSGPSSKSVSDYSSSTSMSSMSMTSRSTFYDSPSRPMSTSARPASPRRMSNSSSGFKLSDVLEPLRSPRALGAFGVLALVLLGFGWAYLPKTSAADVKSFNELKEIVNIIREKRSSNAADYNDVATKAEEVGKQVITVVKKQASSDSPAKQFLLWAARDRMPLMVNALKASPAEPSPAEQSFIDCLRQAAKLLNVKDDGLPPPPPIDPNAATEDNTP